MFRKIVVALDESKEARRALEAAVHLAKQLDSDLRAISVVEPLPSYTAFATALDSSLPLSLNEDRRRMFDVLLAGAHSYASNEGIELSTELLEGVEVKSIVSYIMCHGTDLLVIGLPHHELHVTRLWSSVYSISQAIPCSVLGVH